MKNTNILKTVILSAGVLLGLSSCNKFLDEMPDNRATIDTEEKIVSLLNSAYPTHSYQLITEMMSDNVDCNSPENPYTDAFLDQVYGWEDITESDNEDPEAVWNDAYTVIATANQALDAIADLESEGVTSTTLTECKGEALLCRAFGHYILVNVFCREYRGEKSKSDLGIPYMSAVETTLNPKYDRGTVAEVYEAMEADILEGVSLVGDSHLSVPKYHFNQAAAYAFACKFFLSYQKWDQAKKYADLCLGSNPKSMLRPWASEATETQGYEANTLRYVSDSYSCNLLLHTSYSNLGLAFGPYYVYKKYSHSQYIANNATVLATQIFGTGSTVYYISPKTYSATNLSTVVFWKIPYRFEYTDVVAGIGYRHAVLPVLKADDILLCRAEASIMLKQYDAAAEDLTMWMNNFTTNSSALTPASITSFYNGVDYSTAKAATVKDHLEPSFTIDAEGSTQESMLQCVLAFKRIENLHEGQRWFDVKRYGITIYRKTLNAAGSIDTIDDTLGPDDPRRAIQLPSKVLAAELEANPR